MKWSIRSAWSTCRLTIDNILGLTWRKDQAWPNLIVLGVRLLAKLWSGDAGLERISFITLIPKKNSLERVGEFRPIALRNSILKIVSKALANRLSCVLKIMIRDCQSRFIPAENIIKRVAVAQEVIHQNRLDKNKGYVLKLDFEKAYDIVNWECLIEVLEFKEFGNRWINWIRMWITSIKVQVLVNRELW